MGKVSSLIFSATYRDSVFLMKLSSQARDASGAGQVSAMMATPRNKELFACSGLLTPDIESAHADDLAVAIDADPGILPLAESVVRELLEAAYVPSSSLVAVRPRSIAQAAERQPGSSLAIISVAGDYAKYEAAQALAAGLDVFLYSDNIGIQDELALKTFARAKNLLVMGPDCGTAIVDDIPLGFANRVRRGSIGLVGASGSGLQEVSCLLDRCGLGVSSVYGTGKRDFSDRIGGLSALTALERLAADSGTGFIVVVGQNPGTRTRRLLVKKYAELGKPVLIRYLGVTDYDIENAAAIPHAVSLTGLVEMTVSRVASLLDTSDLDLPNPLEVNDGVRGYIRGIFSGGTLCHEAAAIVSGGCGGTVYANIHLDGVRLIGGTDTPAGHAFLDMGADQFTVGRPHPLIYPELKRDRIVRELCDPEVGVVMTDVILGSGIEYNPAAILIQAFDTAASLTRGLSRSKRLVVSICGTEADSPSRSSQIAMLETAGITVMGNNARAAERCLDLVAGRCHA